MAKSKSKRKGPLDKKRPFVEIKVALDPEVRAELDAARTEAALARNRARVEEDFAVRGGRDVDQSVIEASEKAQEALALAEQAAEEDVWTFRIYALPPKSYSAMLRAHPPTDEQREEYAAQVSEALELSGQDLTEAQKRMAVRLDFNQDTFPRALFAASIRPELTDEELDALVDPDGNFSDQEQTAILNAALDIHTKSDAVVVSGRSRGLPR